MQTYQGSCHCGLVRFEITADLDYVGVCDCSMCRRRGALMHPVENNRFKLFDEADRVRGEVDRRQHSSLGGTLPVVGNIIDKVGVRGTPGNPFEGGFTPGW